MPTETPDTVATAERPVLEVSNLTTRFEIRSGLLGRVTGRVHAVENVSFSLQRRRDAGAGRRIRLRQVDHRPLDPAADRADAGSVLLDGQRRAQAQTSRTLREQRKRMQMIFQDPFASLNPRMTVGAAIAEPLLINRLATASQARDKVADLLRARRPHRRHGQRASRTNSPAASASASASRARSRSSRS